MTDIDLIVPPDVIQRTAQRAKSLRLTQNITRQELAGGVGIAVGTVKRFETIQHLLKKHSKAAHLPDIYTVFLHIFPVSAVELRFWKCLKFPFVLFGQQLFYGISAIAVSYRITEQITKCRCQIYCPAGSVNNFAFCNPRT